MLEWNLGHQRRVKQEFILMVIHKREFKKKIYSWKRQRKIMGKTDTNFRNNEK